MPGQVGIISGDQSLDLQQVLGRMVNPLVRQDWHQVMKQVTPRAAFASVTPFQENSLAVWDDVVVTVNGSFVEDEVLRTKLVASGDRGAFHYGIAEVFLAAFLKFGIRSICGLNGLYTVSIWEENARRLTLVNDRYGLQKLYYWQSPDEFVYASETKAIIQHPRFQRKVNEVGLSDLLSVGFLMDQRTLLEDVQILPGASILTFHDGEASIERYWDYSFEPMPGIHTEVDYIDGLADRVREAVSRRVKERTCILITAGLDSRIAAGFYQKVMDDSMVAASSLGSDTCIDVRLGKQISKTLGIPHFSVQVPSNYLDRFSPICVQRTEGNMSCYTSWIYAAEAPLLEQRFQSVMTGIGGETVSGRHWVFEMLEPDIEKALAGYYSRHLFRFLDLILKPEVYRRVKGVSMDTIRTTVLHAPTENPLNKLDYMVLQQDFRRHGTSIDVFSDSLRVNDPLLDNDLVDYALSIPPLMRARANIYKRVILKYLPDVASIGGQARLTNIHPTGRFGDLDYWRLIDRVVGRVRREIRHIQSSSGDFPNSNIRPNSWMRTSSRDFVLNLTRENEYLEDYFNMVAVNQIVQDHMAGRRNAYRIISAIMTFALWMEYFMDRNRFTEPVPAEDSGVVHAVQNG